MGTYRDEGDRNLHPTLKTLIEWAAYGVIFGLLFLFFLGVYVLADLVF
jgi:hypothetical protein